MWTIGPLLRKLEHSEIRGKSLEFLTTPSRNVLELSFSLAISYVSSASMDSLVTQIQYGCCHLALVKTESVFRIGQHLQYKAEPQRRHRNDIDLKVD